MIFGLLYACGWSRSVAKEEDNRDGEGGRGVL